MSEYPKAKQIKTGNKIIHTWSGKFHNLEGPAVQDLENPKNSKYYVFGVEYSKDQFKKMISDQIGVPWIKKPGVKLERG